MTIHPTTPIRNLASNFEAVTMFTNNESISWRNNKITNEIPTQLNLLSISNNHINKRNIQSSDLIIKKNLEFSIMEYFHY